MSFVDNVENEVQFIAEIGKNFIDIEEEQSVAVNLKKAKDLVDAAKNSGANAVKFQTHIVDDELLRLDFTSPHFKLADRYSWVSRNQRATPLEDFWIPIKQFCDELGIEFFSTPMSVQAAMMLDKLGVKTWKVGSGDVSDIPLLKYLIFTEKPVIISTGMVSYSELAQVYKLFENSGRKLIILYCVSEYPCPPEKFNLLSIRRLQNIFPKAVVGFSDHSIDNDYAVVQACSLGARVIEKHFSFDRNAWGSDHKASLLPSEFHSMTKKYKDNVHQNQAFNESFSGQIDLELGGATNEYRKYFRKGLVYSKNLNKGETIKESDLMSMRPLMYLEMDSIEFDNVIGKRLSRDVKSLAMVRLADYA